MFFRIVLQSLRRRWWRKLIAVLAVGVGTSLVVGLLILSLEVGDRINAEMSAFGANIRVEPLHAAIDPRLGGSALDDARSPATLDEAAFEVLKNDFFWRNNVLGIVPRLWTRGELLGELSGDPAGESVPVLGLWIEHTVPVKDAGADDDAGFRTGARQAYSHWVVEGEWPESPDEALAGRKLARRLQVSVGDRFELSAGSAPITLAVTGILDGGGREDEALVTPLGTAQRLAGLAGRVTEAEVTALTTPDNELARRYAADPASLTPVEYERWACTPYPGSVALDIQKAIPGGTARVVRKVAETEGALLGRIDGLMLILGSIGFLACSLSVLGILTSAVIDRRSEVALLQALGARRGSVLALFFAEAGIIGLLGGLLASGCGVLLGGWLMAAVFETTGSPHLAVFFLGPVMGILLALTASLWPVLRAVNQDTARVLHA